MKIANLLAVLVMGAATMLCADEPKKAATEAVDFRKMKELLPAKLSGLDRNSANGEKNKIGDMQLSQAIGNYGKKDDDNGPRIEVKFLDYGAMQGAAEGLAAWSMIDIDKDSDDGWEKTVKLTDAKYPSMQTWSKSDKHGHIMVMVEKRFMVDVDTYNVTEDQFKKLGDELPLKKLAELK